MYYPLSSGGTPRFGGLDQKRQICFEHGEAWFPGDAAGTEAGQAWERTESAERFDQWMRRPASRRIAWETVNLGNGRRGEHGRGWTCDWNYLLTGQSSEPADTPEDIQQKGVKRANTAAKADHKSEPKTQRQRKLAKLRAEEQSMVEQTEGPTKPTLPLSENIPVEISGHSASPAPDRSNPQTSKGLLKATATFVHLPATLAVPLLKKIQNVCLPALPSLITIRIKLLTRGTPTPCARIYRLPFPNTAAGSEVRKLWLELDPTTPSAIHPNIRATKPNARIKKDKLNHRGNPKRHTVLPFESLDHVNYIPAGAPPEYFQTPEHRKQVEAQAAALAATAEAKSEARTAEERAALLEALMSPVQDADGNSHPACPGPEDLIGFVTSGAYNLAEGRGTAVGSVWVQRVVEGWRAEIRDGKQKEIERRRRLCVVRNAGESVGRLGVWELCV
jgi:ribonuclease P/MRP protein subunit POP1